MQGPPHRTPLLALTLAVALSSVGAAAAPTSATGNVEGAGDAAIIAFTAQTSGPMRIDMTFNEDDHPADMMLFGLYDMTTKALLEVGVTYVAFDGHLERMSIGEPDLVEGRDYVVAVDTTVASGTVTVHDAEPAGADANGPYPTHIQNFYSSNRLRTIDNGYASDVFLLPPQGEPVLGVQLFSTVHDDDLAADYAYGEMCLYSPTLPCDETAQQLDHQSAFAVTDRVTAISWHDVLDPSETPELRGQFEVYNPIRQGIVQLQTFAAVPLRFAS